MKEPKNRFPCILSFHTKCKSKDKAGIFKEYISWLGLITMII